MRHDAALEDVGGLIAKVRVVRVGKGLAFRKHHQPAGFLHRQDAPEQPVGYTENGGVGGNAQSNGNDDYRGEAGDFHQGSKCVADIL